MRYRWSEVQRKSYRAIQRRFRTFPGHDHDHAEVFWIVEGEGQHTVNGVVQRLSPGSLVFIRPEDYHSFNSAPPGLLVANVGLPRTLQKAAMRRVEGSATALWREGRIPPVHSLTARQLTLLAEGLGDLARGRDEEWEIERFLLNLAHLLAGHASVFHEDRASHYPGWLQRACAEIEEPRHFLGGTEAMARLAGKSPGHLAREMQRLLGRTPTEVVNEARLRHAARLLLTTDAKILDISLECGFQGLGHFYRAFQATYRMTPREFRMRQVMEL